jgi:hypothetical protein
MLPKSTRLNCVMGEVSRLPFERRIAPRSDDRMNSPTSPDRLIVSGYLRGIGAVQASVLNAPLFKERLVKLTRTLMLTISGSFRIDMPMN